MTIHPDLAIELAYEVDEGVKGGTGQLRVADHRAPYRPRRRHVVGQATQESFELRLPVRQLPSEAVQEGERGATPEGARLQQAHQEEIPALSLDLLAHRAEKVGLSSAAKSENGEADGTGLCVPLRLRDTIEHLRDDAVVQSGDVEF